MVVDCVGSDASLADALAVVVAPGGSPWSGMPGHVHVDLTGLWQREITLAGAYAYGTEHVGPTGTPRRTFDLAFELVAAADLGRLVSATYPLARYTDAIAHAADAGPRGGVKIAFDLAARRSAPDDRPHRTANLALGGIGALARDPPEAGFALSEETP